MTPDRVSVSPSGVPPLPPRGVPRHWYFCLPGCLSPLPGYLCPLSGSAPRRHREPLPSRFPPRGSFPRVPPSFCCGASGFVRSACGRGAVLPVPGERGGSFSRLRPCRLRGPRNFPSGGSCATSEGPKRDWRLLGVGGARRFCGTRAIFCFVFYFICQFPSLGTARASRDIPGECPFEGLTPERLRARTRGEMNN